MAPMPPGCASWLTRHIDTGCILVNFPEGYRLYEHVKKTEKDGQTEVKTKTHAGGGNDRQDAYLYGHPTGRRKRFRSPADYFPHLLWLCTDESGDPDNCSCKICSPEDLDSVLPAAKKVEPEAPVKQEAVSKPAVSTSVAASHTPTPTPNLVPTAQPQPQRSQPTQTALASAKSPDQQEDRSYHSFMYRPGEVVWFSRVQAWGLGVVLRRWKSPVGQVSYTVQPLTFPHGPSVAVTKTAEHDMRPWLAWSVPAFTHPGLNTVADVPRFDTVDWNALRHGAYGTGGDMEVDGSILAAKSIDSTYTPFGQIQQRLEEESGVTETHFNGLYLGGEKIWVGEPVRLVPGSGTDILVVHSIVELCKAAAMTGRAVHQSTYVIGDMYSLVNVQHSDPSQPTPAAANMNPQLPERLTQDLAVRNAHSIHVKRVASYWKFVRSQVPVDISAIKGRWYEASLLLPILQGQPAFEGMAAKGDIQEASLWMNSRGDCQNANRPGNAPRLGTQIIRKAGRREALGNAIPANADIQDSAQPPVLANVDPALNDINIDPRFDTAQDGNADMDQFMNLDSHGDMAGFGQYGNPSQGFYS